ncbi:NAD(P)/FAD-dependent oxidoreductase [Geomonas sp. RF6]|uniref:NAD(P)/FAD-dependent oxidoreductase n=1 Tax=Geomonas sp. RF6 TaxID=2897342 RepID=UPI001E37C7EF|nr:NAD(P)/FAD-dependent oxidoreductase [Geomonas sp. RF6]UFS68618.1 NAD(P)/FAD-dependent oxidoreductase [Geomonas sp. RF6]
MNQQEKHVAIVGGGFAGLNAAKVLGNVPGISVTIIDARNYHLFQPLLYQVATAGLNPSDIAAPIRNVLVRYKNIRVLMAEVTSIDPSRRQVFLSGQLPVSFDYLILASGATSSYFGHDDWELHAPGLKTVEQATEIRRRILTAFEEAEMTSDRATQDKLLTFVVIGGGPTGVELAGAISEMCHFTLVRDFRKIDSRRSRVILIEAGPRILAAFPQELSDFATEILKKFHVQVRTGVRVESVDHHGVTAGDEFIPSATILWAAGVKSSDLAQGMGVPLDRQGRVIVQPDLSIKEFPYLFVAGDLAHFDGADGNPLPGLAPVALQQGRKAARNIVRDVKGKERTPFRYIDKGMLATIGRNEAVGQFRRIKFRGGIAWLVWLFVHIYYLTGFANRFAVVLQWAWSYTTFKRGARLILGRDWRMFRKREGERAAPPAPGSPPQP